MTLLEAIKSGKRFKRSGGSSWVEPEEVQFWFRTIDYSALIADDWEVEPTENSQVVETADQTLDATLTNQPGTFTIINAIKRKRRFSRVKGRWYFDMAD